MSSRRWSVRNVVIYLSLFVGLAILALWLRHGRYCPGWHTQCFWKQGIAPRHRDGDPFCDLAILEDVPIPAEIAARLQDVVAAGHGARLEVPGVKAGRTIPAQVVRKEVGSPLDRFYESLAARVSKVIGQKVYPAPMETPLSVCLLVYEKEGDFITWHYDSNYFRGRFFTLLLPLTTDDTCTKFQYMAPTRKEASVTLDPDTALLFEGEHVWHGATKLCAGQKRAILSFQFATNPAIDPWKKHIKVAKEYLHRYV